MRLEELPEHLCNAKEIERVIELEGARCLCFTRADKASGESVHSFDKGETWHRSMVDAFNWAKRADALVAITDAPEGSQEDLQSFIIALLQQIQGMKVGEVLKVARLENKVVITREEIVLAARHSLLNDVEISI